MLLLWYKNYDFVLWNPLTGKFENLPNLEPTHSNFDFVVHGYGYDHTINDYKVVSALQLHDSLNRGTVYSEV